MPRRVGTGIVIVLGLLVPATLIGVRNGYVQWLSWPGYLWIAVMFYLLVVLAVLELPRLAAMRLWAARTGAPEPATARPVAHEAHETHETHETHAGDQEARGAARSAARAVTEQGSPTATEPEAQAAGPQAAEPQAQATRPQAAKPEAQAARPQAADPQAQAGPKPGERATSPEDPQRLNRRLLLARGTAIFAGLTAAGITGYGVKTATSAPRIDRFQMPMPKLPRGMDGTRLAVVSDIHLGPLTGVEHAQRIVKVINSVNADLVCVVGDLVDGSVAELGRFAAPLGGIESRRGAYFVTGNHEYYSGYEEWIDEVARLGIRPLRNERVEIDGLDLAGVNDVSGSEHGDSADFGRALGDRDQARPVVLMAHQPVAAKDAAPYGVDLQVSGHTHGGQMVPFNLLVKLEQPVVSGFGRVDGVPVYVTNGAGYWGPPVRVGAPPQVTVIELRTA
ncbi:metallophosphoesterase [Actinoplanes sp. DH11]|uniref:metallophosphoesterase n=1 Tax=Actinoplanes sp. DH11 TaxID=2857011 RepID=UPI0035B04675